MEKVNEVTGEVVSITKLEADPGALVRRATDVAGVCKVIVMKTAQIIQGRKYVRVEGWQSIAAAYGCVASVVNVERVEPSDTLPGGIRATGELRRVSDGAVLAVAEGFVGDDEKMWAGRPLYARRAMAQTRAVSRVCRSAFAFVVTLIDGELSTTPAEEMDFHAEPAKSKEPLLARFAACQSVAAIDALWPEVETDEETAAFKKRKGELARAEKKS